MLRFVVAAAVFGLAGSCELPPFEHEGEHVIVATDIVPEVCAGSLARLDESVERVNEQLGLPDAKKPLKVVVLPSAESLDRCSGHYGCADRVGSDVVAVLSPSNFERSATHELAHARLGRYQSGAVKLFSEGVAVAVSPAICRPKHANNLTLNNLLAAGPGDDFDRASYYVGGELVKWLLNVHGPERVLEFMGTTRRPEVLAREADPDTVRANYRAYFGTELDEDVHAHYRSADDRSLWDVGCTAPELVWESRTVHLRDNLSCDSPRVVNNFRAPDRAYVDWTMATPEGEDRYRLLDELPPDTSLTFTRCKCNLAVTGSSSQWDDTSPVGSTIVLDPGAYRVRWEGPVDSDEELDLRIEAYHLTGLQDVAG